jgi:hypothetical protein
MLKKVCAELGHFYPLIDKIMFQAAFEALNHKGLEARIGCRLCGHEVVKARGV